MSFKVRDAAVSPAAFALPSAAGSVYSSSIDTGNVDGDFLAQSEIVVTAPTLNSAQLPNSATVTYVLQDSADNASFSDIDTVLTQIGASSSGAAAATGRRRLPTTVRRYVRLKATTANTPGDCSGANGQIDLLF